MLKVVSSMKSVLKVLEKHCFGWICRSNKICFLPFSNLPLLFKWKFIEIICLVPLWQYSVCQVTFCQMLGLATAETVSWWLVYNHYFIIRYYSVQMLISRALLLLCHFLLPAKGWKKNLAEWKKKQKKKFRVRCQCGNLALVRCFIFCELHLLLPSRCSGFSFSHSFMSKYCVGIKIILLWDTGYKVETVLIHFEMGLSRFAAF